MDMALAGRRYRGHGARVAGFTILEALVSAGLMLMIAIGVLPMFTRATINNVAGIDYTQVTNEARSRGEEFFQLPFNSEPLTLLEGTERTYEEYYAWESSRWKTGTIAEAEAAGDTPLWTRTTTIRQYNVADLATPLDVSAAPGNIHLKEIVIEVSPVSLGGPVGVRKRIGIRLLKAA